MDDLCFENNIEELHTVLLGLLKEFHRVCKENDIQYFAIAGTLLGAIRHQGFIPWDDDADIALTRDNYEKLKKVASRGAFKMPYFFQNPETDQGFPRGFSRLRDSRTTEIPYDDVAMKCNRGVFIDIIPIDVIPNSNKLFKNQIRNLKIKRSLMNSYARYYSGFGTLYTTLPKKIAYYLSIPLFKFGILSMKKLFYSFEKTASKYLKTDSTLMGQITLAFDNKRCIYKRKWLNNGIIEVAFEDTKICIPKDYDMFLKVGYGSDYMTPLHLSSCHGDTLFSTRIPYNSFIEIHKNKLMTGWIKQTEIGKKKNIKI